MNLPGIYNIFLEKWKDLQTCYIISDTHFNDEDIKKAFPNRPSDDELVKIINSNIGRKDLLIILGDCGDIEYIKRLKGYKILVAGNHDAGRTNYERKIISRKFSQKIFQKNEALSEMLRAYPGCRYIVSEEYDFENDNYIWVVKADNMLFDEVYEGPLIISEKLILSHEPIDIPGFFNLHGHMHDSKHKNDKYHFNVCADVIDYIPINFNQWMKEGHLSEVKTAHRMVIDKAIDRKRKRSGKKIGEK